MPRSASDSNIRAGLDKEMRVIADYIVDKKIQNDKAYRIARYNLMDNMGYAILALNFSECTMH